MGPSLRSLHELTKLNMKQMTFVPDRRRALGYVCFCDHVTDQVGQKIKKIRLEIFEFGHESL